MGRGAVPGARGPSHWHLQQQLAAGRTLLVCGGFVWWRLGEEEAGPSPSFFVLETFDFSMPVPGCCPGPRGQIHPPQSQEQQHQENVVAVVLVFAGGRAV